MSEVNNGGEAFPISTIDGEVSWGMSLRDYFAAKAMAAIVSTITSEEDYERLRGIAALHGVDRISEWISSESYKQADAMLAARETGGAS